MNRFTRTIKVGLLFAAALVLSGCGGGGGNTATPSAVIPTKPPSSGGVAADVTTINGVSVPPDPGATAKASVAGVDTNANGVRDEIERDLAAEFGAKAQEFRATSQFAAKLQSILGLSVPSQTIAGAAINAELKSYDCLEAALGQNRAMTLANDLDVRTYNTKARRLVRQKVLQAAGVMELPSTSEGSCQ